MDGVNRDTVWTWNAIGKRPARGTSRPTRPRAKRGFLLNHLISELLPARADGYRYANADPVTGQAAWYDLRVRIDQGRAPADASRAALRRRKRVPAEPAGAADGAALRRVRAEAAMTSLPPPGAKRLGLVIDLDICVGCHACAVNCKEWNRAAPLSDLDPYGAKPDGVWLNRVHSFEVGEGAARAPCISRARACIAPSRACVTVCPTGASYKRAEDGIVLVNEDALHRLQAVLLGLPLWRARVRRR